MSCSAVRRRVMQLRVTGILLGGALCLLPHVGHSQPSAPAARPVLELSIEEALRRAEQSSEVLAISRAGLRRAEAQQLQARGEWLPSIIGTAAYERTLASEFDEAFEDLGAQGPGVGGAQTPAFFSDLPFGQLNTWRFGVAGSLNLYAGGRTLARGRLTNAFVRTQQLQVGSTRASVVLGAAEAYYDALLSQRLLTIAEATMEQARTTFEQARVSRQVGAKPEFELLRAQVAYENQRPIVLARKVERDLALLRLKQLLDLPAEQPVQLSLSLEEEKLREVVQLTASVAGVAPWEQGMARAPVRQATEGVAAQDALVRVADSQHWPQVSLISSYGKVSYPESFSPNWSDLRTNWTVGVTLQLPLFTGFRITGDVRTAEANLSEAQARLKQTEELAELEVRAAFLQRDAAEATWEASAGTVEQAERANEIAEIRYREGVSTQLELTDSRLLLQQAQANRARAARDAQVARIRVALLAALPLGEAGANSLAGVGTAGQGTSPGAPLEADISRSAAPAVQATEASGGAAGAVQGF